MRAHSGRVYAQILDDRVHWIFSGDQLPEWHDDLHVLDITDADPQPQEGWLVRDGGFVDPATLPENLKRTADAERDTKIYGGVTYNGRVFDSDPRSIANLTATIAAVAAGAFTLPTPFYWRSADNENVDMSFDDLKGLAAAMIAHGYQAYLEAWAVKDQLEVSTEK